MTGHRGRKLSEETRAKISAALRGRKRHPGAVAKSAAGHRGLKLLSLRGRIPWNKGREATR